MWELVTFMAGLLSFVVLFALTIIMSVVVYRLPGYLQQKMQQSDEQQNKVDVLEAQIADLSKQLQALKENKN